MTQRVTRPSAAAKQSCAPCLPVSKATLSCAANHLVLGSCRVFWRPHGKHPHQSQYMRASERWRPPGITSQHDREKDTLHYTLKSRYYEGNAYLHQSDGVHQAARLTQLEADVCIGMHAKHLWSLTRRQAGKIRLVGLKWAWVAVQGHKATHNGMYHWAQAWVQSVGGRCLRKTGKQQKTDTTLVALKGGKATEGVHRVLGGREAEEHRLSQGSNLAGPPMILLNSAGHCSAGSTAQNQGFAAQGCILDACATFCELTHPHVYFSLLAHIGEALSIA
eukprot:1146728-Pelagomonas_calceolata.AAC.3